MNNTENDLFRVKSTKILKEGEDSAAKFSIVPKIAVWSDKEAESSSE